MADEKKSNPTGEPAKKCKWCSESIAGDARVCCRCGRDLRPWWKTTMQQRQWIDILAFGVSVVAVLVSVSSINSARKMFELQRRPWIKVDITTVRVGIDSLERRASISGQYRITNFGQGAASSLKSVSRFLETPAESGSRDWFKIQVPEPMVVPNVPVVSDYGAEFPWPALDVIYLHVLCAFRGAETGKLYYTEHVFYLKYAELMKSAHAGETSNEYLNPERVYTWEE